MTESFIFFMKHAWPHLLGIFTVVGVALVLINIAIYGIRDQRYTDFQKQAIEREYAQFCPKTGHFAWKGECNE